ncbi:MAG: GNAT family N-acetyltransferase [Candidatus Heimdallarchaeaceae archaeon]
MVHFRNFAETDWPSFEDIVEEVFARENIHKENFLQLLDDEGLVGAFREEKLVGYIRLLLLDEYGHLGQIAVVKSERGKGYGNELMEYAIKYFEKKKVESTGLYVETNNIAAISLYEKYGFDKQFESYHYWIDEEQFRSILENYQQDEKTEIRILTPTDFDVIVRTFPDINSKELRIHLERPKSKGLSGGKSIPLGLFTGSKLIVYGRFNPEFPGCRPFLITDTDYLDNFIVGLNEYRTKDYLRITFDRNRALADFCEKRGYRLHHHLFLMEKDMKI